MNDDGGKIEEHARELSWVRLEFVASHEIVKEVSSIRKVYGL